MARKLTASLALVLLCALALQAQQAGQAPFASLEKAIKQEPGGWAGDKGHLSTFFAAERRRLGDRFETELLKMAGERSRKALLDFVLSGKRKLSAWK